jgi:hypothetical protein
MIILEIAAGVFLANIASGILAGIMRYRTLRKMAKHFAENGTAMQNVTVETETPPNGHYL